MILLDSSYWEIKETPKKGRGIFAKKEIKPGTVIADYIGKVIKIAEEDTSEKDGLYLLYYHDYAALYPENLRKPGAHMVNHSCTPNSWIYTYKGHTLFFALRKIFQGEELTISYQLSSSDFCTPCTHTCICDSEFCTGTMHLSEKEFKKWNTFSEQQSKETKRAPIRYGKLLPKLSVYPKTIKDNDIYKLFGNMDADPAIYNESTLPNIKTLRKYIRETGRTLLFPKQRNHIVGIVGDQLILQPAK